MDRRQVTAVFPDSRRAAAAGRPVILTARCGTIDETFLTEQLRQLGAIRVEAGERAPAPQ